MLKKIIHISDVHIKNFKGLDEYGEQLTLLVEKVKRELEGYDPSEVRIALLGDLVHSKNNITPELMVITSTFIRQLSNIAQVICIAGNHDLIEGNTSRVDAISSIFQTAQFDNAVFVDSALDYESGVIFDDNVTWVLYSIYDAFRRPDIENAKISHPNNIVLGLYHGTVLGTKLYNGTIADRGTDKKIFEGCDFVLAGDIHKRQVIKNGDCEIVYAGSTIQQNFGESVTGHGYVVWDLENKTHKFIDLPSNYGLYDFCIKNLSDIENDTEIIKNY